MKKIVIAGSILLMAQTAWGQDTSPTPNLVPDNISQAPGEILYTKLTAKETDGLYTISEVYYGAGFEAKPHMHEEAAETFIQIEGRLEVRYEVDGEPVDVVLVPGSMLHVPPGSRHSVLTRGSGFVIAIFAPGGIEEYAALYETLDEEQLKDEEFMANWRRENGIDYIATPELGFPYDDLEEE